MAFDNRVFLYGIIDAIREFPTDNGLSELWIYNLVQRRSEKMGKDSRVRKVSRNWVLIRTRDPKLISQMKESFAAKGDSLYVCGVLVSETVPRYYFCQSCGKPVYDDKVVAHESYVHPISMRVFPLTPKQIETVHLMKSQLYYPKADLEKVISEKLLHKGEIIKKKFIRRTADGADIEVVVQKKPSEEDAAQFLENVQEGSNWVHLEGNLLPSGFRYNPESSKGGRQCSYPIAVNRKYFIEEDDLNSTADFIDIRSLGDQADLDRKALNPGAEVSIDGSLQGKYGFPILKECPHCGFMNKIFSSAIEVIPYSIEYGKGCNKLESTRDEEPDLSFYGEDALFGGTEENDQENPVENDDFDNIDEFEDGTDEDDSEDNGNLLDGSEDEY